MVLPEPDPDGAYLLSTIVIGNNQEYRIDQPPASANLASLLAAWRRRAGYHFGGK
jgi:hypothetical protein